MKKCAIQGIEGSYSEDAARKMLGADVRLVSCIDFNTAFRFVVHGEVEYAVLPMENKIIGRIAENNATATLSEFTVHHRLRLPVDHILAAPLGVSLKDITKVVSHPAALSQCGFFLTRISAITTVPASDTAIAIRDLMRKGETGTAAIGSRRAAAIYRAYILSENISDETDNWTEFGLIGRA